MPKSQTPKYPTWESYFIPGTYDGMYGTSVLRNRHRPQLRDIEALEKWANRMSQTAAAEIRAGLRQVPMTFDAEHVKALHRALFGSVYPWAGQYREQGAPTMQKGVTTFAHISIIDTYIDAAAAHVRGTDWPALDLDQTAEATAVVFANLNQAHAFREGNGRTAKLFLEHVSELSNYRLDFERISSEAWNQRSALTAPDPGTTAVHPEHMVPVFKALFSGNQRPPERTYSEAIAQARDLVAAQSSARRLTAAFPGLTRGFKVQKPTATPSTPYGIGDRLGDTQDPGYGQSEGIGR